MTSLIDLVPADDVPDAELPDAVFEAFVDWYMKATGYGTKYTEATRIAGINPPPYVSGAFDELLKKLKSVFAK